MEKANVISEVCSNLMSGKRDKGEALLTKHYPFYGLEYAKRSYSKLQMLNILIRDGFIDRYSGQKLIFPPVLRVLSETYPNQFPYHPNWKVNECHPAYWDLSPTMDHIVPIVKGGENNSENLVSTSMLRNSAKSNFTLEELGWKLYEPGKFSEWDGMIHWFMEYVENHQELLTITIIKQWYMTVQMIYKKI
ncbi:HNH endonuclease [Peribacillus glennii]|uniref:HNH endonuclease n=1 Tax=Peribacillus glennii TaxID=2303991 RepID=A0A372L8Y7_9BACI|nr:HNH endonuclease [Peribacillus glennii]RFU60909.1 HNH endonuclease [Peribacillus glennii]